MSNWTGADGAAGARVATGISGSATEVVTLDAIGGLAGVPVAQLPPSTRTPRHTNQRMLAGYARFDAGTTDRPKGVRPRELP